jgi:hypothetical protein
LAHHSPNTSRSLEDLVYQRCPDLIANCVVVGNGRPQPALFVEVHEHVVRGGTQGTNGGPPAEEEENVSTKTTGSKVTPAWWSTPEVQRRIKELKMEIVMRVKDDMELK